MRKLTRTTGSDVRVPAAPIHVAPPEAGLVSRMGWGVRRLVRAASRGSATTNGTKDEQPRVDPGASRSAMDAGLTGGISLLFGGSDARRRE